MDFLKLYLGNLTIQIIAGIFVVTFFIQTIYYLTYYRVVIRRNRKEKKGKIVFNTECPPVSIIICARNEEANLEEFLPLFLEQDYPNYEVIVVNDGSWDNTEEVLKNFSKLYSHLYYTSIPEETKIISRKKLAITVGVKAAKNDLLLFSDADCRPLSSQWIKQMVRNFTPEKEFVLGYGSYFAQKSFLSKMISYDTQFIAMQYMGFAYAGAPYMAVGRNLAYRKETFFRVKGFAGNLHIASGDDDLMINHFGNKRNTTIETSLTSITQSIPKQEFSDWLRQKYRHLTSSSVYTSKSKFHLTMEPISRGLFYVSFILLCVLGNIFIIPIALLLFFIRWIIQVSVFNSTAKAWKDRKMGLLIIIFDILLPIINLFLLTFGRLMYRSRNNNW